MRLSRTDTGIITLPNAISALRLALVPAQLILAWLGHGRVFLALFAVQVLSDALDGFLARRLNQTTRLGARLDSWSDLFTYLTLPLCAWWLWPDLVRRELVWLVAGVAGYLVPAAVGFLKFRLLTSYHTWLSKFSAVLIPIGLLILFLEGPAWGFHLAVSVFVLSGLEEVWISLALRQSRSNVPSLWHATRLARSVPPARTP